MPIAIPIAAAIGAVSGGAFGLSYGAGVTSGYNLLQPFTDAIQYNLDPQGYAERHADYLRERMMDEWRQTEAMVPEAVQEYRRIQRSEYFKSQEEAAEQQAASELPPGATVLPSGLVSYHGQVYEERMPMSYRVYEEPTQTIVRPFNYAGGGGTNWPSFFESRANYPQSGYRRSYRSRY